ncbi:MAG: DNA cytosine methyltransferase [Chlamydiales bacterium]|nr:DNA cytosine methyltransferase [Chlamydiales bacterium]
MNRKLKISELVENISLYIRQKSPETIDDENFQAIITHYLHNPNGLIPGISKEISSKINEYFSCLENRERAIVENCDTDHLTVLEKFDVEYISIPFKPLSKAEFTFIDLFAGVGGFRIAMQRLQGRCVFSSEWDQNAKKTYSANFGEVPYGDITKIDPEMIPNHDILCGGFPCQAFSVAGYRKGFQDEKGRGNLFFNILDILKAKQPKAFFLENVKNLEGHDKGNTFKRIKNELSNLGYSVIYKVLNSKDYSNVPQTRERIFIVGFNGESNGGLCTERFFWPEKMDLKLKVTDLIEQEAEEYFYYNRFPIYDQLKEEVVKRDTIYQWRRIYVRENKNKVCPTLTANMGTGGHNVPLVLDSKGIRKLTPRECFRFQGYPDEFILPEDISRSHLYKQAGNSVTVPLIERIATSIKDAIFIEGI